MLVKTIALYWEVENLDREKKSCVQHIFLVVHNTINSSCITQESFHQCHLSCAPLEPELFLQRSVISAAPQQTSSSAQQSSPIKEKQTGHFDFANLTCEQHDGAKSPASPAVSWVCLCLCEGAHVR